MREPKKGSSLLTLRSMGRNSFLSLGFLLFSNVLTIFVALSENWNVLTVLWVYWFQSVTIGFFNFIRILQLKEFSTEGFKINNQPAQPTQGTKYFTAFFFLFHYGFFHFLYMVFLLAGAVTSVHEHSSSFADIPFVLLLALVFFLNHLFSYFFNKPKDTKKQNIGSLMFYPYARILPMHLTIIFGFTSGSALPLFLVLKTIADAIMHVVEHAVLRKGELQKT